MENFRIPPRLPTGGRRPLRCTTTLFLEAPCKEHPKFKISPSFSPHAVEGRPDRTAKSREFLGFSSALQWLCLPFAGKKNYVG